ncbi:MAG: hypothetical protein RSB97_06600, partial [Christensenella sp.]
MKTIRTKPTSRAPRILSKTARVPKEILRQSSASIKNIADTENHEESPQQYAENKVRETAEQTGQKVKDGCKKAVQQIRQFTRRNKIKERVQPAEPNSHKQSSKAQKPVTNATRSGKQTVRVERQAPKSAEKTTYRMTTRGTREAAKRTIKGAAKSTAKGTVKSFRRTVKTARNTVKTSKRVIKTAKVAVKTAQLAAKAVQVTLRAARIAAKAAVKAAKVAAKVTIAIVKAIIAAVKALVAAIVAGGWVVVLIILIAAVIMMIIGSALGIFFAEDSGGLSVKEAITEINEDFSLAIDTQVAALSSTGNHNKINVIYDGNMDGDSDTVNNWKDVLIVFAVNSMAGDQPPIRLTPESKAELQHIFYSMNSVSYRAQTMQDEEKKNVLNIFVTITSKAWQEGADSYAFDKSQRQIAEEMARPEYYPLFAELLGTDIYGGITSGDLTGIISGLPPGTKGTAIVQTAITRLGHPYSQPKRGQGDYVDCSYFTWWAYKQVGIDIPMTAAEQGRYCAENA